MPCLENIVKPPGGRSRWSVALLLLIFLIDYNQVHPYSAPGISAAGSCGDIDFDHELESGIVIRGRSTLMVWLCHVKNGNKKYPERVVRSMR
jgi:hypothetical protein